MNAPHPDDSLLALGWMKEPERLACERALASDPARAASLRRNEDMLAQLAALGPLHPAPASVRTGALVALAADPSSGLVPGASPGTAATAAAAPVISSREPHPLIAPRRARLLRHPLAGWTVAAAVVVIALLGIFRKEAETPHDQGGVHANPDHPPRGSIRRTVVLPSGDAPAASGSDTQEPGESSLATGPASRTENPNPRHPAALPHRTRELAAPVPSSPSPQLGTDGSTPAPPVSLNRMVVITLRPPGAPLPLDQLTTTEITDRLAAAVSNDPGGFFPGASQNVENAITPNDSAPPLEDAPPSPGFSLTDPLPDSLTDPPSAAHDPSVAATPSAWAIFNETSGEGSIVVDSLPPLGPEEVYQIWLVDAAREDPLSVGMLPPLPNGSGHINFTVSQPGLVPQDFLLTKEQASGAARPSPSVVLRRP
ncbi:MAG: anti-sigma factor domain-containing protein [Verrucomicrobiales bacterium]